MDSRQLKLFAAVTAIAALLFAYLAFQTSREQQSRQQLLDAESFEGPSGWSKAVVALMPLPQGEPIAAAAVKLVPVSVAPAEGFTRLEDVVGKSPGSVVGAGEPLTRRHFSQGSELTRGLGSEERAVAIQVNEVVGVGGFITPGDRVDVLVYVPADGNQIEHSQAQVVLERVRVLTYGNPDKEERRPADRTAVLAVPVKEVPRLVLAANAGQLRLALHGTHETFPDGRPVQAGATLRELDRSRAAVRRTEAITVYRGSDKGRAIQ